MNIKSRVILALSASGLLAACASTAPAPFVPGAAANQAPSESQPGLSQPAAESPAGKSHTGRVLYVADIDGQPGVGQILVYNAGMKNPQLLRTITSGAGRPFGMWVDAKDVLYVANQPDKFAASVTEFKPGASSPFFTITSFKGIPGSVAVDAQRNVWVNENVQDEGFVQEFAPGSNTAKLTVDTGVGGYAFGTGSVAFDPHGNLIIAESAKLALHVVEIAAGSTTVTPVNLDLTNITGPGLGVDKAGNIYVASSDTASVSVFAPGQTEPSRTISQVAAYGLTAVTPQGAVYQASGNSTVAEIKPGSSSPTFTLTCQCSAQGVAVSH